MLVADIGRSALLKRWAMPPLAETSSGIDSERSSGSGPVADSSGHSVPPYAEQLPSWGLAGDRVAEGAGSGAPASLPLMPPLALPNARETFELNREQVSHALANGLQPPL